MGVVEVEPRGGKIGEAAVAVAEEDTPSLAVEEEGVAEGKERCEMKAIPGGGGKERGSKVNMDVSLPRSPFPPSHSPFHASTSLPE